MMLSLTSVAYIGPKSRTERARKNKIGTEVAHVTRDSDSESRTPLSRSKGQRSRSPGRFTHRGVNASRSCNGERGNVLAVGTYCYVAVCTAGAVGSAARGASAPTEGGEGRGHIVAAARLQLVYLSRSVYGRPQCRIVVSKLNCNRRLTTLCGSAANTRRGCNK